MLQEASGAAGHPSYRRYHYGEGPLLVEDGTTKRFISTDALGSTTDLTGSGGAVASMRKYDAWGQYRNDTAPSSSEPKLGFTGHQYDPETGLVYARARYYDAEMGRFLARDSVEGTIADAPSLHRFMYVRGNPLRYSDPTGHCAVNKDGTVNCLAPAMAMQRQLTSRMSAAWAEGNYGKAAYNLLLATANTVSVAAGAAAQLVVGTAFDAGYDASAGFRTGDYDRALRGSTELLMVAGGEHVMKGAQWVEKTAAPAVKKVVTQAAEDLTAKLAPEVAGAERAAVTEAVEQATKPGTARVAANEVGTPRFRSVGAAAKDDPALAAKAPAATPATPVVRTPWSDPWTGNEAVQAPTREAEELAREIGKTRTVYRAGQYDVQNTFPTEPGVSAPKDTPLTWAPENPALMDPKVFAERYGFPMEKADWIEIARLKENATFVTRSAGPYGGNPGGALEVVVEPTQIEKVIHTTP